MSAATELPWRQNLSDANLRLLFASAPLWFADLDAGGNLRALNPAFRRMLEPFHEIELSRLTDLIDPELKAECERLMQEMFEGRRDNFQLESKSGVDTAGAVRWTVWRVTGWSNPGRALALAEEIKGHAESDDRLRQAMRLEAVGRLAAGVVHDFNNLLTGVLLYCDLLLGSLQNHQARKYAEEIRSAGLQAAGVVRQLLNVARLGNSKQRLLSLNEVIESLRELLSRLVGESIHLDLRLDPNLGLIRLDDTQAQQILLNLVLNARDAMPNGGRIEVETRSCDIQILNEQHSCDSTRLPCVLLVIADEGSGMDEDTRAHLFEAFFTTKGGKGMGLGLAGVYDIVTGNGGLIHVDSALGCGTRVSVLLPLAAWSSRSFANLQQKAPDTNRELLPLTEEA